jgi:hypothetical protein
MLRSTRPRSPSPSKDERVDEWIRRRTELDRVLKEPAISLIRLLGDAAKHGNVTPEGEHAYRIRTTVDEQEARFYPSLLIHAVACSAVQRLQRERRRFTWIDAVDDDLRALRSAIPTQLVNNPALRAADPLVVIDSLQDPLFGTMNPLIASEVFWLLIRAGEDFAHGDLGFLALFAILWALRRRTAGPFVAGAALGHWRPTVAVTARCLLPIFELTEIIDHRVTIYDRLIKLCDVLQKNENGRTQREKWLFASTLDSVSSALIEVSGLSMKPKDFMDAADTISGIANQIGPEAAIAPLGAEVRAELLSLLRKLGTANRQVLEKAEHSTSVVQKDLLAILSGESGRKAKLASVCGLKRDWREQIRGAEEANDISVKALRELQKAVALSQRIGAEPEINWKTLTDAFRELAVINRNVRDILAEGIAENIEWCRQSVTQEVAYASAGKDTDFDAAELLSGVVVAHKARRISRAEIENAIKLSMRVARDDGSWAAGQPIHLEKRVLGVWPSSFDLMMLLASAVSPHERLTVADKHLMRFVGWLDGRMSRQRPSWWKPKSAEALSGWPSEAREPGIDIWSTATAIRAALEIRNIIEDRLWEICEERFTVLRDTETLELKSLDPVDLGTNHSKRLQTRLVHTAAATTRNKDDAEYSFVLHGPPGSSKTAIAQAIGREMWRGYDRASETRFVRITPADFTRHGEAGLDVEARFIFRLLSHVRYVTIFFDEIEDLLRIREVGAPPSFIRLVVPGMLNRLQDLRDAAPRQEICFLLATNYVDQIEPALTRPGRIDATIPVPYPDPWSRENILESIAPGTPDDVKNYVVAETREWPWSTFRKLCEKLKKPTAPLDPAELVNRFRTAFQPADYYYQIAQRWKSSSPLVTEFVHYAFTVSKNKSECLAKVKALESSLPGNEGIRLNDLKLQEKFEAEWRLLGRPG